MVELGAQKSPDLWSGLEGNDALVSDPFKQSELLGCQGGDYVGDFLGTEAELFGAHHEGTGEAFAGFNFFRWNHLRGATHGLNDRGVAGGES